MRIWSLHPKYLDAKGLVALWRETLLAKHVLEGTTKAYKNHPQLNRFKGLNNPLDAINQYLSVVYEEAVLRGYQFNQQKISWNFKPILLEVTSGQINFEVTHLLKKLEKRDITLFEKLKNTNLVESHTIFEIVTGEIEPWEII